MTQKITILLGLLVALAFAALSGLYLVSGTKNVGATSPSATVLSVATTSTAYSVTGAANIRILATTTGSGLTRSFASICNPSANIVYLNLNRDRLVSASSSVVMIGAAAGYQACYEITDRNLYQGSVQASSTTAGPVSVFVTDYVEGSQF